jgi:multidrug efflux system outer membrane protein
VETRRDVLVTLAAEVARNYIDLRTLQQRIELGLSTLKAQEHTAELTRRRFEAGFVSGLDVANANAEVATTAAQIPVLEASARQTIYSLGVLLGREPAAVLQELSPVADIPAAPPSVPMGIPSELLRQRPDIRAVEAEIHAATARIGVATADLFPKFSITGAAGYQSATSGSWFNWISRFWSFGPSASWRLFSSGGTQANIEVQKALEEQALITYRQTVLTALQEVENALIASTKEQEHRRALEAAVAANRKAVDLSMELYISGQTDFLNVLAARRSLYASQDALTQSNGAMSTELIALYKALGGGWQATADSDR